MTDGVGGSQEANRNASPAEADGHGHLSVLLVCFDSRRASSSARRPIQQQLRSDGDAILDTVILRVKPNRDCAVYDPRRVLMGTLTATLTWGAFGLVAGGLKSLALWAILGAICGGLWAYYTEHLLTKNELVRVGAELPADSSSLVMFVETTDSRRVLERTASAVPKAGSVASIGNDLSACVFVGPDGPIEVPSSQVPSTPFGPQSPESLVLLRYPDPGTARDVARRTTPKSKKERVAVRIEAVIWADSNGRRHVADPSQGVAAWAKSDIVSWGLFGVVVGALAGAFGGGGVHAFVDDAVVTGVGWAIFGLIAGALYGLWAGRAVSARRVKRIRKLLPAGRSMLVGWADDHARQADVDALTTAGSQRLIIRFNPVPGGAVLEAI
jgi:uncharacterized membrane protein